MGSLLVHLGLMETNFVPLPVFKSVHIAGDGMRMDDPHRITYTHVPLESIYNACKVKKPDQRVFDPTGK